MVWGLRLINIQSNPEANCIWTCNWAEIASFIYGEPVLVGINPALVRVGPSRLEASAYVRRGSYIAGVTTMVLDDYLDGSNDAQQATHFKLENPDHPDVSVDEEDIELLREHFDAATYIQQTGVNRQRLVGDFLAAFAEAHRANDEERLEEIIEVLQR